MALNGKIAVVTGAALGIGNGKTRILLKNGAKVRLYNYFIIIDLALPKLYYF